MTQTINTIVRRTAVAVALTLCAAGGLKSTDAHAFGLGDITGAAKKVGGAVKKGAKKAGSAAVEVAKTPVKTIYDAKRINREIGGRIADKISADLIVDPIARVMGPKYVKELKKDPGIFGSPLHPWESAARAYNRAEDRAKNAIIRETKRAAGDLWGYTGNGKYERRGPRQTGPVFDHPGFGRNVDVKPHDGWGRPTGAPRRQAGSQKTLRDARAPVQGITRENLRPLKGRTPKDSGQGRPLGRDKSVWGRPSGIRKPIGRDKSVWGRPSGAGKPMSRDRSRMGRPAGITRQYLRPRGKTMQMIQVDRKPSRDLSRDRARTGRKFDDKRRNANLRMKRGGSMRMIQLDRKSSRKFSREKFDRKRSRNGRDGRRIRMKRQNFRMQMKRGNNKRSFRKRGRGNRRG